MSSGKAAAAPPQLGKLPQKSLEKIQEAVQVLLKYGVDGITNLKTLQLEVEALFRVFQQSMEVLWEYGFEEKVNLQELSNTLERMVSRPAAAGGVKPPPGMTSKDEVTGVMRERQRQRPTTWCLPMRQWLKILDYIESTELYSNLRKKQKGYVSMYDVNQHFVKPWTRGSGCGLSVLMTPESPSEATLMMSHAWAEDMKEMRIAVEKSLRQESLNDKLDEIQVWFCVFANYQPEDGHGPSIPEQLALKPFKSVIESPTVRAGQGMCAIHTSKADLYTRLWCVHEVAEAQRHRLRVFSAMSQQYAGPVIERTKRLFEYGCNDEECSRGAGILCNSSAARCSRSEDEKDLTGSIYTQHPGRGFTALDEIVQEFRLQQLPPLVASMCYLAQIRNSKTTLHKMMGMLRDSGEFAQHLEVLQEAGIAASMTSVMTSELLPAVLRKATEDKDTDVREAAVQALAEVAQALLSAGKGTGNSVATVASAILPALLRRTSEESDSRVREATLHTLAEVAKTLCSIGEGTQESVAIVTAEILPDLLRKIAEDEDSDVRSAAVQAVAKVAKTLLTAGDEPGNSVATATSEILPALLSRTTEDQDSNVRRDAVEALGEVAKTLLSEVGSSIVATTVTAEILPALLEKSSEDEDSYVRREAVLALAEVAKSHLSTETGSNHDVPTVTSQILPALLRKTCDDDDKDVRTAAVQGLSEVAQTFRSAGDSEGVGSSVAIVTSEILPALLRRAAEDKDGTVRREAVEALAEVTKTLFSAGEEAGGSVVTVTTQILPVLLRRIAEDKDSNVRREAAESLAEVAKTLLGAGEKGENSSAVVSSEILSALLETTTEDDDGFVREATVQAVAEVAKTLLTAEKGGSSQVTVTAEILPSLLRKTTEDDEKDVREAAVQALVEVAKLLRSGGEEAGSIVTSEILPALLRRTTEDKDSSVRQAAKQALAALTK